MRVSDFNYDLPEANIAQFPPKQRGTSRLLVLDRQSSTIEHRRYSDLIDYIQPGDVVVLNNTKVIKARLVAKNSLGKDIELLLLESHANGRDEHRHQILYRGNVHPKETLNVHGTVISVERVIGNGIATISSDKSLVQLADQYGTVPLPPYMKRDATEEDTRRYQTEFAKASGSVAAPTASLNFTKELKSKLEAKGARVIYLTLHVGLGTFLPIRTNALEQHEMHSEYFEVPRSSVTQIRKAKQQGRKIFAVGTTVCRTLEFAAEKILGDTPQALRGEASIFIYPGYEFKLVDALLTNFHAPRSTVLMMAAAFVGWEQLEHSYQEALRSDYQFLSYGDSMLIL
jgi:S-adenosylmethionine:tRNA ribosyltransferase-isomerase